jgi:OOP family OmpA-OmpF porin
MLPGSFSEIPVCPGKQQLELSSLKPSGTSTKNAFTLATLARETVYVLVQHQAGQASQTLLSPAQAQALLPELRRQSHAVSRVPSSPVCQPEPVAPVVAEPVVVPAPIPTPVAVTDPTPARYTLAAEMLFNFAGSQPEHLSEQGQTQILRLGKRIKEQLKPGQVILVQGHTDPMGSAALNQRLSLERAQTVSRILVNSGLPARQLRAEGMGGSQLLVKDCQQMAKTRDAKLQCNRPNRRVEITVNPAKN